MRENGAYIPEKRDAKLHNFTEAERERRDETTEQRLLAFVLPARLADDFSIGQGSEVSRSGNPSSNLFAWLVTLYEVGWV